MPGFVFICWVDPILKVTKFSRDLQEGANGGIHFYAKQFFEVFITLNRVHYFTVDIDSGIPAFGLQVAPQLFMRKSFSQIPSSCLILHPMSFAKNSEIDQPIREEELLLLIAKGNDAAMKSLFSQFFPRLHYFAYKLISNDLEAEDIAQEALLSFWQKRMDFSHQSLRQLEAYLFTIARNRCYNYLRNKSTRDQKAESIAGEQTVVDDLLERELIREDIFNRIFQEIRELPPAQAELLKLIYIDDLETAEIAEKLQTTPNNIRNQKARALEKLKTRLLFKRLLHFFYNF